jgi:type IV secretory pathway TrbL component
MITDRTGNLIGGLFIVIVIIVIIFICSNALFPHQFVSKEKQQNHKIVLIHNLLLALIVATIVYFAIVSLKSSKS